MRYLRGMSTGMANALVNYRRRLDGLRAIDAAVGDLSRRLSDQRQSLYLTNAERARIEPASRSPQASIKQATEAKLNELATAAAKAQSEINVLAAELARQQERRGASATLLARCRDYLREAGVNEGELAW